MMSTPKPGLTVHAGMRLSAGSIADVLARINDMPQARLAELLPWNWSAVTHQKQAVAA